MLRVMDAAPPVPAAKITVLGQFALVFPILPGHLMTS
jgi:hypothetical protein